MFMDSESFYYSLTYDLTNSVQRQSTGESDPRPLWQKVLSRLGAGFMDALGFTEKLKPLVSELSVLYLF